ncbi:type II toxin-antitoxin system PemK/MazF family toxin [Streptomyces sp. 840.1]|uniref:type II toxin-antitoxin system PemK/MazF family toxin n=1 Tax=Streptomyces sp. 840.1 TaxID=2485152 RepID=UPI000F46CF86|nr:type II toxin-antitoxin system PemK/MazF family toxin [Streptomyces sp. 840.1]
MNMTGWWIAFALVLLLGLVAALNDGRKRGGRRPQGRSGGRSRPPAGPGRGKRPAVGGKPRAGEIWWAEVPFEDGPGSKDRPCLVMSVRGGVAHVAKITSKDHGERPGVIALPRGTVGDARGRDSFLETDELRRVAVRDFRRRVGELDPQVWERVRGGRRA